MVILMGDLNCSVLDDKPRSLLLRQFFSDSQNIPVNCLPACNGMKSTFVSYDGVYESVIDYICLSSDCIDLVSHCEILDDDCLNVSRHRPVTVNINFPVSDGKFNISEESFKRISWKRATDAQISDYVGNDTNSLNQCTYVCDSKEFIDSTYTTLCDVLTGAVGTCIGHRPFQSHSKPYWDSGLREYHKQMRYYRSQWCRAGLPRNKTNAEYMSYRTAKRDIK
ncbi:hypothetical protein DPMN_190442 [Dreissena polymorpha]|uniref:Uncharacterized protein n=1 Tax=Dreissena polymorpha TaxID=45954 RepID=A0A9D4DV00_DREPO|nr:hypothetical protein DPMN_190442 [Dreissena polymorpha]